MLNNVIVVGRLCEIKEYKDYVSFRLAVLRSYKNKNGVYETDFIRCRAYRHLKNNLIEWCRVGDLIGVKGNLQLKDKVMYVNAEKITFLQQRYESESEK